MLTQNSPFTRARPERRSTETPGRRNRHREATLWQDRQAGHRVAYELRGQANYALTVSAQSAMWEVLSGDPSCAPPTIGLLPARCGPDAMALPARIPGSCAARAYGLLGGDAGITAHFGPLCTPAQPLRPVLQQSHYPDRWLVGQRRLRRGRPAIPRRGCVLLAHPGRRRRGLLASLSYRGGPVRLLARAQVQHQPVDFAPRAAVSPANASAASRATCRWRSSDRARSACPRRIARRLAASCAERRPPPGSLRPGDVRSRSGTANSPSVPRTNSSCVLVSSRATQAGRSWPSTADNSAKVAATRWGDSKKTSVAGSETS